MRLQGGSLTVSEVVRFPYQGIVSLVPSLVSMGDHNILETTLVPCICAYSSLITLMPCAENNKLSPAGTIDLHGLYVKEAIERTESAISQAQASGQGELRVIVGKGIHSQGHVARIKPAVEELMQK